MIPLLWLTGPPGVGKTAVAWEIYQRLVREGAEPAYVDVDQLGICYPPPSDDPDRHALKARNVAALRASFAASGARTLIVSGVVDAQRGPHVDALGGAHVMVGRLRADPDELRMRLRQREGPSPQHAAAVEEGKAFDRGAFADWSLDTSGLSIDDAATRVLREIGDWPPGEAQSVSPSSGNGASRSPFRRRNPLGVRANRRWQVDDWLSRLPRCAPVRRARGVRRCRPGWFLQHGAWRPFAARTKSRRRVAGTSTRLARDWPLSRAACPRVRRPACTSARSQARG